MSYENDPEQHLRPINPAEDTHSSKQNIAAPPETPDLPRSTTGEIESWIGDRREIISAFNIISTLGLSAMIGRFTVSANRRAEKLAEGQNDLVSQQLALESSMSMPSFELESYTDNYVNGAMIKSVVLRNEGGAFRRGGIRCWSVGGFFHSKGGGTLVPCEVYELLTSQGTEYGSRGEPNRWKFTDEVHGPILKRFLADLEQTLSDRNIADIAFFTSTYICARYMDYQGELRYETMRLQRVSPSIIHMWPDDPEFRDPPFFNSFRPDYFPIRPGALDEGTDDWDATIATVAEKIEFAYQKENR